MTESKPIQLGLCCINTKLRGKKPPIFCSRRVTLNTLAQKGIEILKERIIQNLKDCLTMIEWNEKHGIKVMRLSSELFPHKSNPKVEDYGFEFAVPLLKEIGKRARKYGHRLSFHPGQYNVVGTPTEKCFQQTKDDLKYHADVLEIMEMGKDSVLVVHGGGIYGDKEKTLARWCKQFKLLDKCVRKRLVLENCEKCFSIEDCLKVSEKINIPVVFDTHHYECYAIMHPTESFKSPEEYMPLVLRTWKNRGIKPKFHVSEQGLSARIGHHSDLVKQIPEYLLEIPEKYGINIDIMIEAKLKEQAIFKLYKRYPYLNCSTKSSCQITKTQITKKRKSNEIKKKQKQKQKQIKKQKQGKS